MKGVSDIRLRILVFAPKSIYINPTEEEFFSELAKQCDIVFHGPGFVPLEELEADACVVYEKHGPFDFAIVHQYFLLDSILAAARNCHFPFDVKRFCRQMPKFPQNFSKLPCIRIAQLLRMDYYAVSKEIADLLEGFSGNFLAWSAQFIPSIRELRDVRREDWKSEPTDIYREFAIRNHHRIIPYMHTVSADLFQRRGIEDKRYPVDVPGHLYAGRHDAVEALRCAGYRVKNRNKLVGAVSRFLSALGGPSLLSNPHGISHLQNSFRRRVEGALVAFTDGSRLRWPLRKYFEIPAFGSLLVCEPFLNAEDLGFVAGEHYVAASPEHLPDIVRKALDDPEWTSRIIDSAQAMVWRRHLPPVRVSQVIQALHAILKGSYQGARWEKGVLNLEKDNEDRREKCTSENSWIRA